jgi:hypothetical protein
MHARIWIWIALLLCHAGFTPGGLAVADERWTIVVGASSAADVAMTVAVTDLVEIGADYGVLFTVNTDNAGLPEGNLLVAGPPSRNTLAERFVAEGVLGRESVEDEEGYAIQTIDRDGRRIVAVRGGSILGDVYGLYWILDRLQVHRTLPEINVTRIPAMKQRVAAAWGRRGLGGSTQEQMRSALRYSSNWVSGPNVLDLVPWDVEPEATNNAATRENTRELIEYAHALHMKYFAFTNDFTFHPSLLEEFDATLSPCDPAFWEAVGGKYRKLFEALPKLDGVEICNDDISGFWDDYRPYDLMHETPECEWSYPKRFRTFVKTVHDVVVGEFDKTYFHFTWGLTAHEQHVQPAVFREIFTDAVPTANLYLIPKVTMADRWWHQPYNTTFNQTAHETIVCFETMNYYEGGSTNIFPTFSGRYFQNGLQTFLLPEDSNLRGAAALAGIRANDWGTTSAYIYVLYRLMWDPYEDMETIARDFCAIHFGPEAADAMAAIYLLSPNAYKYGLHIEPISYGQFNSFIHMRVGTFPVEGYPEIDGGREHLEFLRRIYLRCDPWRVETLADLDHGLAVAREMGERYEAARPLIGDPALAEEIAKRLAMTRLLIETNNYYVRTMFAFFDYYTTPTEANRTALADTVAAFAATRDAFVNAPGFGYHLFGVDQLLRNAQDTLEDIEHARYVIERAPTRAQLEATIADQQRRYADVLEEFGDEAIHFGDFEAMIDGRDILNIRGDRHFIQHIRWDGPEVRVMALHVPLPQAAVTVVPKDLYSRPLHPFVLEQPTAENDYTVRIYLDDAPGGKDWVKCELYYIQRPPEELGLALPWEP